MSDVRNMEDVMAFDEIKKYEYSVGMTVSDFIGKITNAIRAPYYDVISSGEIGEFLDDAEIMVYKGMKSILYPCLTASLYSYAADIANESISTKLKLEDISFRIKSSDGVLKPHYDNGHSFILRTYLSGFIRGGATDDTSVDVEIMEIRVDIVFDTTSGLTMTSSLEKMINTLMGRVIKKPCTISTNDLY